MSSGPLLLRVESLEFCYDRNCPLPKFAASQSKHAWLLEDDSVSRWLKNTARGSTIAAEVPLRRLGKSCKSF